LRGCGLRDEDNTLHTGDMYVGALSSWLRISGPVPHKVGHPPNAASESKTDAAVAVLGEGKSQATYQAAEKVCSQEAEKKTIGSLLAVVTHLRPRILDRLRGLHEGKGLRGGLKAPLSAR
jgi:hypothetical protein